MGIRAATTRRLTIKIVAQALAKRELQDRDANKGERQPTQAPGLAAPVPLSTQALAWREALGAKYPAWDSSLKYLSQPAAQSKIERRMWEIRTSDQCLRK